MDFVEQFKNNTNNYTAKINDSKYVETTRKVVHKETDKGVSDICELIIRENELEYLTQEGKHKEIFAKNKKITIAENVQKNENYARTFTPTIIQHGFQHPNHLSSVLYLNEYYKINCIIYNPSSNKYYRTSLKNYPKLVCIYKKDKWYLHKDSIDDSVVSNFDKEGIENVLTIDTSYIIYKPYLNALSNYKLPDLVKICSTMNISILKDTGKKKLKKELYDEINLKVYEQDT